MNSIQDLLKILVLDKISENKFNGISKTVGSPIVFGGQVIAQAINAAYRTVRSTRILHSLHSYFLEAGNLEELIAYQVEIIRDGGSFSTRRVTASQGNKIIFILAASFHKQEDGHNHQIETKTDIKPPEDLMSWDDMLNQLGDFIPKKTKAFLEIPRTIEFKPTVVLNPLVKKDLPPFSDVWFRLKGDASQLDLETKQQVLAYISDYNLLAVAMNPHASIAQWGNTQTASLDHSMWFFRDFDFSDWMLFSLESPSASNARGFCRGHIYTREGKLIVSVAQEGLLRPMG